MKRISILTLALMLLLNCTAFAANWAWIDSNDKTGFFFDTDTIKYSSYHSVPSNKIISIKNTICFWEKMVYTSEAANHVADQTGEEKWRNVAYVVSYVSLDKEGKYLSVSDSTFYNQNGDVIDQSANTSTARIIPGTMGDSIYQVITNYAKNNDFLVEWNTTHI